MTNAPAGAAAPAPPQRNGTPPPSTPAAPAAPAAPASPAAHRALPHWDLTPFFPSLASTELGAAFDRFIQDVAGAREVFDRHQVRKPSGAAPGAAPGVDTALVAVFEDTTTRLNRLAEDLRLVDAYLAGFVTTDSRNDTAQARLSELQIHEVELQKLSTRYEAWIGALDVEALIRQSKVAQAHSFELRKLVESARHLMTEAEEDLAASLSPSSGTAWTKLHGNVSSQLMVSVRLPGGSGGTDGTGAASASTAGGAAGPRERVERTERLPMSAVRGLAHDPDPAVRRAAYEAELAGWETVSVPLAAAMNGIKGEANTLNARRGWPDALAPVLFRNNIDQQTLDAMHEACRDSFPDFRRYLRAKARLLGQQTLPWWDLFAPVGGADGARHWSFEEAGDFVVTQFGTYSDRLADLARRAITERWVDAEPRDGKVDGAFCMNVRRDESRVLMNFEPSFNSVQTLAHELGHAYHNVNLAPRTPMQRHTPMGLAETASIFCETIVVNAALARATGVEKLAILEGTLQGSCQVVVDIHSRFLFEQRVFEQRARRELSVTELNALMLDAQRETYGDGLDGRSLHQFMWAMKPHYYMASFYNWPYTFGFLFGLGLYARYREDAARFRAGYDDLLSSTGMESAAGLAQRFGIDIRSSGFWRGSLDVCREQIRQFEELAG